jgi:predicted enzyme related to lactoylglutathione lyase
MNRLIPMLLSLFLVSYAQAFAAPSDPAPAIQYVGSVSLNPSQEAKVLADWYGRLGVPTKEMGGGYYGMLNTAAGPFFFGIHPRLPSAPAKSSGSVAVVFRVSDYDLFLANAARNKVLPQSTEADSTGRFAHFHDPDGNEMTIWGQ